MAIELARRLQALESIAGTGADRVDVIIRRIVRPGVAQMEAKTVYSHWNRPGGGWRIDREPGESEVEFLTRAANEAPRPAGGMARLVVPA